MEEHAVDKRFGFFVNHDLASYEVPVHADIPHQEVIFLDKTDPISSPMKAKGVGELGICGAARRSPTRSTMPPACACAIIRSPSTSSSTSFRKLAEPHERPPSGESRGSHAGENHAQAGNRRESLASALAIALGGLVSAADGAQAQQVGGRSRVLVAFFSRSGNTRLVAGHVRRTLGADLFEIQPAQAYPEDYEETVRQAERERDTGFEPPLKATVADIASYDTIFLGFPIWERRRLR